MHNLFLVYLFWYAVWNSTLHIRQSSTQNNKHQVSHQHSRFFWWWAHGLPKRVEMVKYTKNKLCTNLALSTRLYRDIGSPKHKKVQDKLESFKLPTSQMPLNKLPCTFSIFFNWGNTFPNSTYLNVRSSEVCVILGCVISSLPHACSCINVITELRLFSWVFPILVLPLN